MFKPSKAFAHSAFEVSKVDSNSNYAEDGIMYDLSTEEIVAEENLER